VDVIAAKARALGANAEIFKGKIMMWNAEMAKIAGEWKEVQAASAAIVAQNKVLAANMKQSGLTNQQIATEAQILAAQTAANVASLKATIDSRVGINANTDNHNMLGQAQAQIHAQKYAPLVQNTVLWSNAANSRIEGTAAEAGSAARFFAQASEAAYKAANMTQSANGELAAAYASAREAAGKAGASIETGKYGGFTAHASVSSSGTLGAGSGASRQISEAYNVQVQETDDTQVSIKTD
jgi:hypothetical protein